MTLNGQNAYVIIGNQKVIRQGRNFRLMLAQLTRLSQIRDVNVCSRGCTQFMHSL